MTPCDSPALTSRESSCPPPGLQEAEQSSKERGRKQKLQAIGMGAFAFLVTLGALYSLDQTRVRSEKRAAERARTHFRTVSPSIPRQWRIDEEAAPPAELSLAEPGRAVARIRQIFAGCPPKALIGIGMLVVLILVLVVVSVVCFGQTRPSGRSAATTEERGDRDAEAADVDRARNSAYLWCLLVIVPFLLIGAGVAACAKSGCRKAATAQAAEEPHSREQPGIGNQALTKDEAENVPDATPSVLSTPRLRLGGLPVDPAKDTAEEHRMPDLPAAKSPPPAPPPPHALIAKLSADICQHRNAYYDRSAAKRKRRTIRAGETIDIRWVTVCGTETAEKVPAGCTVAQANLLVSNPVYDPSECILGADSSLNMQKTLEAGDRLCEFPYSPQSHFRYKRALEALLLEASRPYPPSPPLQARAARPLNMHTSGNNVWCNDGGYTDNDNNHS